MSTTRLTWSVLMALLLGSIGYAQPAPGKGEQNVTGDNQAVAPERFALPNVPYIGGNWQEKLDGPQDFMFPAAMGSVMKFLNPATDQTYRFYLDVSGLAYQQFWHPTKWDCAFDCIWAVDPDPVEPIRRCFEAAGRAFRVIGNAQVCQTRRLIATSLPEYADPDALRQQVCASLRAGKPVIAIGLYSGATGAAVVAGYEEGGEVLVGWAMEDDKATPERDDHGYLRFRDWLKGIEAVVLVGDKRQPVPMREVCRQTLVSAVTASRTPRLGDYAAGQAAFAAWADALGRDADLQVEDLARLQQPHRTHCDLTLAVAEGRAFAYEVLDRAVALEPAIAADVDAAMDCYHLMHDLVWRLWQTEGRGNDQDPDKLRRFTTPEVRAELSRIILLQRDLDALATCHLAKALAAFGVKPDDLPPAPEAELAAVARLTAQAQQTGANRAMLQRQSVDLWLGDVPQLRFMSGRDCPFIAALAAALAPTARPVKYADLMAYSGLAFRTRWFDDPTGQETAWGKLRWHPVSPHGEGPEELAALSRATGWQFRREELPADPDAVARHRLVTDFVVSVNDGLPVVIGRNTDLATAYGYNIHSMNLFLRDYQQPQEAEVRVPDNDKGFQSPVVFLTGLGEPLSPREALLEALRLAVRNGARPQERGFRYGLDALAAWEQALAGYDAYNEADRDLLFLTNWWCLIHLADARRAAADFLGANLDLLGPEATPSLTRAFTLYQQESGLLQQFAQLHTRFIRWWGGGASLAQWDAPTRQAQQDLLTRCQDLESEALKAVAEARVRAGAED
jgi:hypothetical protein